MDDNEIPMIVGTGYWALINLISMILTALISLLLIIFIFIGRRKKEEEDEDGNTVEKKIRKRWFLRLLGIIPAVAAIILFYLTEDMSMPMVIYDKWTIAMIFILFVELIVAIASKKKEEDDEDEDGENGKGQAETGAVTA
jgi:uncharacterized membrane protein